MAHEIKRRWLQGTNPEGQVLYFNLNALNGLESAGNNKYVLYLGGGERVALVDCTFSNDYPNFIEVAE